MPRIDARTGDIVIRIVYDGMPEAGKTTNIQQLFGSIPLQRRGNLASPEAKGRRTEFFDWLDFAGGFVDGRRVRCQLISVPGQPQLLHRRKYLLDTADVVVFVADSQPMKIDENRAAFAELVRILGAMASEPPVAVVVQANKQDLPDSLRPRSLASAIEVSVGTPVVPAASQAGRGVMDTFVLAARLATDRVRALMGGGELAEVGVDGTSSDALHAAMLDLERRTSQRPSGARVSRDAARSFVRSRKNDVERARACRLPRAESLLAGHVWPPVKGRASVAAASVGTFAIPSSVVDWAPADPIELASEAGWLLHSSSRWLYALESEARSRLMDMVRGLLAAPELVPDGRSVLIAQDEGGFRLWIGTPDVPSLASELVEAIVEHDRRRIAAALDAASHAAAMLEDACGSSVAGAGAAGVLLRDGRVALLALPGAEDGVAVVEHALALAMRTTAGDEESRAWVESWRAGQRTLRPGEMGG